MGGAARLGVWFRRQVPLWPLHRGLRRASGASSSKWMVATTCAVPARTPAGIASSPEWGYRVLRLDAELIEQQLDEAVARVRGALAR